MNNFFFFLSQDFKCCKVLAFRPYLYSLWVKESFFLQQREEAVSRVVVHLAFLVSVFDIISLDRKGIENKRISGL